METERASSSSHKEWRRLAKKQRRKRIRRKAAQERDTDELLLRATLERSANYTNWLANQIKEDKEREAVEQHEHNEKEKLWLEEELRAQKEFRINQERKAKVRKEKIQQEEIIRKEFEAQQEMLRKKKEESKRLYEEVIKKHVDIQKQIDDYIDKGRKTPEALRIISESQSGKEICPFFTKTGACRYGETCSRNHRKVALSKVILIPGFYSHFSLEKNSAEYDTDITLEFESSETRRHFREFYDEVVPELESFGRIRTLKYCCNSEIHLRGNLYVEYRSEREAARAWRKLKGRFWAGRQLNCEFVNLKSWRDAVCGMNKCPKGRACNFLHTFRNPKNEYDVKSPPRWAKKKEIQEGTSNRRSELRSTLKWDDFDRANIDESRNWRWSESPERGFNSRTKSDKIRRNTEDRSDRRSRRNSKSERRRENESDRSSSHSCTNDLDPQRRKNSSIRSRRKEDNNEEEGEKKYEEHSSRKSVKKSRKRRSDYENEDNEDNEEITRKDSNVRRSKVSKTDKSIEQNQSNTKKIIDSKSKAKSKSEKEESDENFDTNSNKSSANDKNIEVEDEEEIDKSIKFRWDEIHTDSTHDENVQLNKHNFVTTENTEIAKNDTTKKLTISTEEYAWDTTDSESEEKCQDPSP